MNRGQRAQNTINLIEKMRERNDFLILCEYSSSSSYNEFIFRNKLDTFGIKYNVIKRRGLIVWMQKTYNYSDISLNGHVALVENNNFCQTLQKLKNTNFLKAKMILWKNKFLPLNDFNFGNDDSLIFPFLMIRMAIMLENEIAKIVLSLESICTK